MKATFIESKGFTDWVTQHLPDETFEKLQQELMHDPNKGTVMRGCGGLRKIRIEDPKRGKGKRGGARVIYLYVAEAKWFYMLDIYDKHEQENLSAGEKKLLSKFATEFKLEAKAALNRHSRRKK